MLILLEKDGVSIDIGGLLTYLCVVNLGHLGPKPGPDPYFWTKKSQLKFQIQMLSCGNMYGTIALTKAGNEIKETCSKRNRVN